ncbi:putative short chain dehydrogenase/reductase family oxidoreductase [Colletotrichum sublineola]|uniref:Putative short chain dehydrogenase/reductase family oxidoreductase n=1 Tax=Colletotrichum sublineola TaxID=1173701 RepID=A0A066XT19_COLSU|nr:putative short chain dehydrogenase/reductase family oxidoreductase [Colletotrichum sublineola]
MANTVYVVTGTNNGIGLGLVKALLARSSITIVASVRNEEAAASLRSAVAGVARGNDSELHVMLLDFTQAPTPAAVIEAFKSATLGRIDRVDVLISNAAAPFPMTHTHATSAEDLRNAFEINTIAPLMVVQGLWPLMKKIQGPSDVSAKFIGITSSVGSIGSQEPFPAGAYGPSKAALNWLVKSLHAQHEGLVSVAIHPGWVQTYMGNYVAQEWKYDPGPPDTIDSSANGVLAVIDGATRETTSGKFVTQTGEILPW